MERAGRGPFRHKIPFRRSARWTQYNLTRLPLPKVKPPPIHSSHVPSSPSLPSTSPHPLVRYLPESVEAVADITSRYPGAHGGPIHWGDPAELGLDLASPDWGDAVTVREGEIPVFWACGVTPQTAIEEACLPLAITHAPGHMFICDITDQDLDVTRGAGRYPNNRIT